MNKKTIAILVIVLIVLGVVLFLLFNNRKEDESMNHNSSNVNISDFDNNFNFETRTVTLNSGYEMPILGLGTWAQNNEETANFVYYALTYGYRLIDTAQYYGNEKGVGKGLKRAIDEGIVTREEVFITTKIMSSSYNNAYSSID